MVTAILVVKVPRCHTRTLCALWPLGYQTVQMRPRVTAAVWSQTATSQGFPYFLTLGKQETFKKNCGCLRPSNLWWRATKKWTIKVRIDEETQSISLSFLSTVTLTDQSLYLITLTMPTADLTTLCSQVAFSNCRTAGPMKSHFNSHLQIISIWLCYCMLKRWEEKT